MGGVTFNLKTAAPEEPQAVPEKQHATTHGNSSISHQASVHNSAWHLAVPQTTKGLRSDWLTCLMYALVIDHDAFEQGDTQVSHDG